MDCDHRLGQYRKALDSGAAPATMAVSCAKVGVSEGRMTPRAHHRLYGESLGQGRMSCTDPTRASSLLRKIRFPIKRSGHHARAASPRRLGTAQVHLGRPRSRGSVRPQQALLLAQSAASIATKTAVRSRAHSMDASGRHRVAR